MSTSLLNASVALTIQGGLPSYLYAAASLYGSVSVDSSGLNFSASGNVYLIIGSSYLNLINISYSSNGGALWRDLNNDAAAVAAAFVGAYNWSVAQINQVLQQMGFGLAQIEQAIASAFQLGAAAVVDWMVQLGYSVDSAIQTAINTLGATGNQIASALQNLGWGVAGISSELQAYFNASPAAIYNALLSIGDSGAVGHLLDQQPVQQRQLQPVGRVGPGRPGRQRRIVQRGRAGDPVHAELRHQPGLVSCCRRTAGTPS